MWYNMIYKRNKNEMKYELNFVRNVDAKSSWDSVYLIAVAHHVVCGDEPLEHDHPVRVLGSLDQQVGQGGDRHVRLICTVQQV